MERGFEWWEETRMVGMAILISPPRGCLGRGSGSTIGKSPKSHWTDRCGNSAVEAQRGNHAKTLGVFRDVAAGCSCPRTLALSGTSHASHSGAIRIQPTKLALTLSYLATTQCPLPLSARGNPLPLDTMPKCRTPLAGNGNKIALKLCGGTPMSKSARHPPCTPRYEAEAARHTHCQTVAPTWDTRACTDS